MISRHLMHVGSDPPPRELPSLLLHHPAEVEFLGDECEVKFHPSADPAELNFFGGGRSPPERRCYAGRIYGWATNEWIDL